ncbi:MAG: hypothetical protein V3T88_03670 [Nitrosomonadaceae bacterium]
MSKFTKIKIELDSNPGLYSAMSDQAAADELNAVDKSQNKTSMTRQEIYENIDSSALASLTSIQLDQLNLALSDAVDPFGNAAQVFINVFGGQSDTITALQAARVETVSQATKIGISFVYASNVQAARAI